MRPLRIRVRINSDVGILFVEILKSRFQIGLPLRFPHPDVHLGAMNPFSHAEERRILGANGELNSDRIPEILRPDRQMISSRIGPDQFHRNFFAVM